MPQSGAPATWWDRWFKRQSPPRPQSRQSRPARQRRKNPASTGQSSRPAARQRPAQRPAIVIQQASSMESQDRDRNEDLSATRTGGTGGSCSPPGPSGMPSSGAGPSDRSPGTGLRSSDARPSDVELNDVGSTESGPVEAGATKDRSEADSQYSQPKTSVAAISVDVVSDESENVNRVVTPSEAVTETALAADGSGPNTTPTLIKPLEDTDEKLKTEIGESRLAIQGVHDFSYETKERKKISELTLEGQRLLELWRDALDKKNVLAQLIRECTDAANQSGERLSFDVQDLEHLYGELAEALANLQRTTSRRRAVKKDIKAMTVAVSNVSVNEQAEVGKVAAAHEKEVYSKWQSLKGIPADVEALEKLRKELTEKQRAISGLESLVQRRLAQAHRNETGTSATSPPSATKGRGIPQRIQPSPSRRGRTSGKRKLADEARHERRGSVGSQPSQLVMRGQAPTTAAGSSAGGVAAAAVATQAGFFSGLPVGSTAPVSAFGAIDTGTGPVSSAPITSAAPTSVPPPPPPPPLPRLPAADDEDSGPADSGADETSTSNDEEGVAFPLHLGPGLFDGLDPAQAARAVADAINFH